ncbi:MAG: hypothetical protein C0594_16610 [Marinilabiliales bacterium]|nr:MAG: hypothetical protein C0594_16610 [Marinilabiliales bacterium]
MILIIKKVLRVTGLGFILGGLSTKQAIGHVRIFTPNSLKQLINKNGGKLISLCYSKPYFTNIFVVVEKDS